MTIKDTKEGQTHFQNDGCGEPEHNNKEIETIAKKKLKEHKEELDSLREHDAGIKEIDTSAVEKQFEIEKEVEAFWKMLDGMQFISSTNSVTYKHEEFPPAITDMEAIVDIRGEFDKYGIDDWLKQALQRAEDRGYQKGYGKGYKQGRIDINNK